MWIQFFLENTHFAVNLFSALVFFGVFWLYFDSWMERKNRQEIPKLAGLLLLTLSYVVHAVFIETTILEVSILGSGAHALLLALTRIPGYLLLIFGLVIDPLQKHPEVKTPLTNKSAAALFALPTLSLSFLEPTSAAFPVLAAVTGFLYLRRATIGLENHLKPVALAFFVLAFGELFALASLFEKTTNVNLYSLVAPFGPFWIIKHAVLILGILILGGWAWVYLLKRLEPQLFMIFTTTVLIVFLLTTVTFTALLVKNLQDESLARLDTDVKVLNLAVDSKKAQILSDAQLMAQDDKVKTAVEDKDRLTLAKRAQAFLLTKNQDFSLVVDENGQVLARGEDVERTGDSLSDDPLIARALVGEEASTVAIRDGVFAPEISVRAVVPVRSEEKILGAVMMGVVIDNAFVDGVKEATGLEAAVYGDNILSATTLVAQDGKSRWIGTKEENEKVKVTVLQNAESFTGSVEILNTPYFAAYLPLKDVDGAPIGMLFVGKPQVGVLQTAGRSIELTFLVTALLLVVSVIPAFLISKHIAYQLH